MGGHSVGPPCVVAIGLGAAPSAQKPSAPPAAVKPAAPKPAAAKAAEANSFSLPPAAANAAALKPPPPKGSHVPQDKNNCVLCHGDDHWDKDQRRLYIPMDALKKDVHWNAGVNCHDCHGGNYKTDEQRDAHLIDDGFRAKLPEMRKQCAVCHKAEALELRKSVHEHANTGAKNQAGQSPPLDCDQCHGKLAHELLPVHDPKSPVFLDHQIKTCGGCHEEHLATYLKSVHGQGLEKLGLMVVPACADCHGAHGVYPRKIRVRRFTLRTSPTPAASAIATSRSGWRRAFTGGRRGRADWRSETPPAASPSRSRVALRATRSTTFWTSSPRSSARRCRTVAATATSAFPAATR